MCCEQCLWRTAKTRHLFSEPKALHTTTLVQCSAFAGWHIAPHSCSLTSCSCITGCLFYYTTGSFFQHVAIAGYLFQYIAGYRVHYFSGYCSDYNAGYLFRYTAGYIFHKYHIVKPTEREEGFWLGLGVQK